MGFKGYVNTDSGVLTNNAFGVEKLTIPQRFAKAVKAGVSLFSDNNNPQGLIDAVHQDLLREADLNSSVTLLLTEIFQLGLFENPYTDPDAAQRIANSPASAARADEAHRKSIVLLRNDGKLLPLTGAKKIYVQVMAGQGSDAGRGGPGGGRGGRAESAPNPINATCRTQIAARERSLSAGRGCSRTGGGRPAVATPERVSASGARLCRHRLEPAHGYRRRQSETDRGGKTDRARHQLHQPVGH
jgi:beta-glucosidase-like glycosyl hydrolase